MHLVDLNIKNINFAQNTFVVQKSTYYNQCFSWYEGQGYLGAGVSGWRSRTSIALEALVRNLGGYNMTKVINNHIAGSADSLKVLTFHPLHISYSFTAYTQQLLTIETDCDDGTSTFCKCRQSLSETGGC